MHLPRTLDVCRELYNDCLQQRKWNHCSRFEQQAELPALKAAFPVYKNVYSQVLQSVLDRLNKSSTTSFVLGLAFRDTKGRIGTTRSATRKRGSPSTASSCL